VSYSKLHSSVVNSSLWTQPDQVRLLFVTLLALADKEGYVFGSRTRLLQIANVAPSDDLDPWEVLLGPDPDSSDLRRCPENEGRRIEEVEGGFRLLNFEYYRALRHDEDRREQNRAAQARYRQAHKPASARSKRESAKRKQKVSTISQGQPISEAEAEADPEKTLQKTVEARPKAPPDSRVLDFLNWYQGEYARRRNGAPFLVNWGKDGAIVRRLLAACDFERLKLCAIILLSDKTDDPFIVDSDRGIGVFAARFNWLSDRLAAWEARQAQGGADVRTVRR
jgi:hypothetical protein